MDKKKKNPAKFNIQFNIKNPNHKKVIDILTPKGRNTAEYIAEAILYFEKNNASDLRQTITKIVCEIIGSSNESPMNPTVNNLEKTEVDFDVISEMLAEFKK